MKIVFTILLLSLSWMRPAKAQRKTESSTGETVALIGLDALGMDPAQVASLETLLRKELERLTGSHVPGREEIAKLPKRLRSCDGNNQCLSAIARALGVNYIVTGNVAALGDAYILNMNTVTSGGEQERKRVESAPLRGDPNELIESVRVAAYRLLAPEALVGAIMVLTDRKGARVQLDGHTIGTTPLPGPITGLSLGIHKLRVSAGDFGAFESDVRVRFQKTTRIAVQLVDLRVKITAPPANAMPTITLTDAPRPWYAKRWFLVGAGVGAVIAGIIVGGWLEPDAPISCERNPAQCMP